MIIGIPKELKSGERRVAVTPDGVKQIVSAGHKLLFQKSAGELSGFSDEEYSEAGATLVSSGAKVWEACSLLVKVKEPDPREYQYFRPDLSVFSFLHPAANLDLTTAMLESNVTGLDYDLVTLESGRLPILEPMSMIAGKLSIQNGARCLEASSGGIGILLGGTPSVDPAKVVIVGCGNAGQAAAEVALGMGADTTILDINEDKLSEFARSHPKLKTTISTDQSIDEFCKTADLLIGAVLIPGAKAPKILKESHLKSMRPGSVMIDICIDQGGFAETSRPTTIDKPSYIEQDVVHCCVANMPAMVPRTSTMALTIETIPWILNIANQGVLESIRESLPIKKSLTMYKGQLTNKAIADSFDLPFSDIEV